MKLNCVQIFYDVCESHFQMFYCLNSVSKQGFLCLSIYSFPDLRTTSLLKGTVTQNIFSFKSGPKGCKDLGNDDDLQK